MDDLEQIVNFEFEPRMSSSDALMWAIEKDPLLRSTITTVLVFDRPPDRERLTYTVDRASRVVPRLRQRVVAHAYSIAPPRWEVDPNFDLSYHLRWIRPAGDHTVRGVLDLAAPIAMQGFDRARPLWEFTVVDDLEDGRAALIAKIHHSITDGVGGIKLMMELLDLERDPEVMPPMPEAPEPSTPSEARRLVDALTWSAGRQISTVGDGLRSAISGAGRAAGDVVGAFDDALRTVASIAKLTAPAPTPLSPVMKDRSLSVRFDDLTVEMAPLKAAARVVHGRLNDAFLAAVSGGLASYHRLHGAPVTGLRMTMPINVRTAETEKLAGNRFIPARFVLPLTPDDPIGRMEAMRTSVARLRNEPALGLTEDIADVLNRLPVTATTAVFGAMLKGTDVITSNVPGPPVQVYLGGSLIERQVAFGPMTGAATNVVLLSYGENLHLGITTDPAAIPDPEVFVSCLAESFDEVASVGVERRRPAQSPAPDTGLPSSPQS